ncbi:hypothetical protein B0O99DRAFT_591500 [Bisporella sp. PMI_857]|nr:hypothetical protein B0O99DRAFT_591500 [Bisporella sp. PMI_857]
MPPKDDIGPIICEASLTTDNDRELGATLATTPQFRNRSSIFRQILAPTVTTTPQFGNRRSTLLEPDLACRDALQIQAAWGVPLAPDIATYTSADGHLRQLKVRSIIVSRKFKQLLTPASHRLGAKQYMCGSVANAAWEILASKSTSVQIVKILVVPTVKRRRFKCGESRQFGWSDSRN